MAQNPAAKFGTMRGKTPEEAKFFWTGGPVEVAPRTWFASQFSGCTAFETDEGLVLVDTGTKQFRACPRRHAAPKDTGTRAHRDLYPRPYRSRLRPRRAFLMPGQKAPRVITHTGAMHLRASGTLCRDRAPQCSAERRVSSEGQSKHNRKTPTPHSANRRYLPGYPL